MQRIVLYLSSPRAAPSRRIVHFSHLHTCLSQLVDAHGHPLFGVSTRFHPGSCAIDPLLARLDDADVDQLWLLGSGAQLAQEERAGVQRFRQRGGGLLTAHLAAGEIAQARSGPATTAHERDVLQSEAAPPAGAACPGAGFQSVRAAGHIHPVMHDRFSPTGVIRYLPASACGRRLTAVNGDTGRLIMESDCENGAGSCPLAVASERHGQCGRALVQSSLHAFSDAGWQAIATCREHAREPQDVHEALRSTRQYAINLATWLGGGTGEAP